MSPSNNWDQPTLIEALISETTRETRDQGLRAEAYGISNGLEALSFDEKSQDSSPIAMAPIHTLPMEILLQVLAHILRPYRNDRGKGYYRCLISLSGVCRRWCHIIRGSPSLWAGVYWSDSLQMIETALQRSAEHLLCIELEYWVNWGKAELQSRCIPEVFAALGANRDRWRNVDISLPTSSIHLLADTLNYPAPKLEKLRLKDQDVTSSEDEIDILGGTAPRLKDLTLNGVSVRWTSGVFLGLTSLDLSWIHFPSAQTVIGILSHSRCLEQATIHRSSVGSTSLDPSPTVQLRHLSSFTIDLGELPLTEAIISRIEVPGLCSFGTTLRDKEDPQDFINQILVPWIKKWKSLTGEPVEKLLLEIYPYDFLIEVVAPNHSRPLRLALDGFADSWFSQYQRLLTNVLTVIAPWTSRSWTALYLRLGDGLPALGKELEAQFLFQQLSLLPPITSLEISSVGLSSFMNYLVHQGGKSLFKNVHTLVFPHMDAAAIPREIKWITHIVRVVNEVAGLDGSQELQRVELWTWPSTSPSDDEKARAAAKDLEVLVGKGKVFLMEDS